MIDLSLVLTLALGATSASANDYVGRWNVRITDSDDTFVSGGFDVERGAAGLQASIVWRWGSVVRATKVEDAAGLLRMVREAGPGKQDVFEARLEGAALKGQVRYADGKIHLFEGKRAPDLARPAPSGWDKPLTLFDGKTLGGWRLRDPKARMGWAVVDGELAVVDPEGNADLVSVPTFQDFKLHIEFNVEPHSNSGVYLRGRDEVQILDEPAEALAVTGCGALYGRIAPKAAV